MIAIDGSFGEDGGQILRTALMTADAPSQIVPEGETHNPFAPPFDFPEHAFLPLINRMGPLRPRDAVWRLMWQRVNIWLIS
ncbi:MAG TPA: RNA 3'-terminal phosphate cyclase [Blastocatellia bacterium]|nr:RNA 3'-terminal phosphate cyclase [Blastocatellia bacterium]